VNSMKAMGLDQYSGPLDPQSAATGMQAARLNALDLIESSKLLRDATKHAHSAALSVLAIEECGKIPIILQLFLGDPDTSSLWKGFRKHLFKGKFHNPGILASAKAFFPKLDKQTLATMANGPPPEFLDGMKQLGWYSECFQASEGPTWHPPKNMDWAEKADMLLAEAKALALNVRDHSPEELEIWKKHFNQVKVKTSDAVKKMMGGLRNELVQKNFIKKEWWDGLLNDIEDLEWQEPHYQPPAKP
jgi:AbiV family abortive infection protein